MESTSTTTLSPDRERAIRAIKVLLFTASIIPALVGGAVAYAAGPVNWSLFALATIGLFVGQAGGDYLYYYMTHFHTDARDAHTKIFAGWRPLFTGSILKPEQSVHAGIACLLLDLGIAIYFYSVIGTDILWFAFAGGLIAIFFTPLMLRGLKEPVIFITFGPLCVSGMTFALTRSLSIPALVASVPVGLFITVVAYLKSARFDVVDQAGDQVILKLSRAAIMTLLGLGYLSLVVGVALRYVPVVSLAGLLSLPLAWSVTSVVREKQSKVADYLWATVRSIVISVIVGVGIAVAFVIQSSGVMK
jgi:1,4-dihydroxy-2-naphthoate octaprenyltransferase